MQHHEESIAAYVERMRHQPDAVAVITTGSVARGLERPDSDVDLCLVLTEEAFTESWRHNRLSYVEHEGATYEGGYFDIKVASPAFLRQAAERGDDPMRASFLDARVAWTRIDDLDELIATIPVLPDQVWDERMASFIAQARLHGGYFLDQAVKLGNTHLLHHAAVHLVSAGGRALLALNRTLFQGHKYLDPTLARLERMPPGYRAAAQAVLESPDRDVATAYLGLLEDFHDWPLPGDQSLSTFVRDNELAWFSGLNPPEFC